MRELGLGLGLGLGLRLGLGLELELGAGAGGWGSTEPSSQLLKGTSELCTWYVGINTKRMLQIPSATSVRFA